MHTILTFALLILAVPVIVYLYHALSDMNGLGKGKCNSKDYEIAEKIAEKKEEKEAGSHEETKRDIKGDD